MKVERYCQREGELITSSRLEGSALVVSFISTVDESSVRVKRTRARHTPETFTVKQVLAEEQLIRPVLVTPFSSEGKTVSSITVDETL